MDDDASSTSGSSSDSPLLSPNSPFQHPPPPPPYPYPYISTQPFPPPPPIIILPNSFPTYYPPHPYLYYEIHNQYYYLAAVAPPPAPPPPQFQYSHYFEQESWGDSTSPVSAGPRNGSSRRPPKEFIPLKEEDHKTTIVIKNIAFYYTRETLLQFLDDHCKRENERLFQLLDDHSERENEGDNKELISAYDFVYLPIDFSTRKNKGYAFVNFTNPKAAWKFYQAFDQKPCWKLFNFNTSKKLKIFAANNYQGKEALVRHFQQWNFDCDTDEYLPLLLDPPSNGSGAQVNRRPVGKRTYWTG